MITLTNDFHGTSVTLRTTDGGIISDRTYRRACRALCPAGRLTNCMCTAYEASGRSVLAIALAEPVGDFGSDAGWRLWPLNKTD